MMREPMSPEAIKSILAPEPTASELAKEDAEISPEMWLVAGYLANELSPRERAAFEHMLATDDKFADQVEPVLLAWKNAPNSLEEDPISDADVRRSWLEFRRKVGMPPLSPEDLQGERERRRYGTPLGYSRGRRILQLTGSLAATVVVLILGYINFNRILAWVRPGTLHTVVAPLGPPPMDNPPPSEPTARLVPSADVRINAGSVISLHNGARFTWRDRADTTGVRDLTMEGGDGFFVLRGVPKPEEYRIITPSAIVRVTGTTFFLDASNPSVTIVDLIDGHVTLTSRGGEHLSINLLPSEKGRAEFGKMPEVIK